MSHEFEFQSFNVSDRKSVQKLGEKSLILTLPSTKALPLKFPTSNHSGGGRRKRRAEDYKQ
jgi:hypothetical protein